MADIQQFANFKSRYIYPLILFSLFILGCKPVEYQTHLDKIRQQGYITMVTRPGPSTFQSQAKALDGFEYELAQQFAAYLGVELKVREQTSLNRLFRDLNQGQADFAAAGLSMLESRKNYVRFGPPYLEVSSKVVFKQGNRWPRNISQLDGELRVVANSSHAEKLLQEKQRHITLSWKETAVHSTLDLVEQVLQDKIAYTLLDSNELALLRRYYPELAIAFTLGDTEQLAWGFKRKDDDSLFLEAIRFFGEYKNQGLLAQLTEKYYGHIQNFDYVGTRHFLRAVESRLPKYKDYFLEAAGDELDWRLLAALSYQESQWNPKAKSPTGVRGMMMLTLPTAKQMGVRSRLDPYQSIHGGAKYLWSVYQRIPDRIPEPDKTWFALAAYNIGWGHLDDARIITEKQGGNADSWADVKERLPLLRKREFYKQTRYGFARGDEPVHYVTNIRRYYETLVWLDYQQQMLVGNQSDIADSDTVGVSNSRADEKEAKLSSQSRN